MKRIVHLLSATILVSIASAGEPAASPAPEPRFKISGFFDTGITFNPDSPRDNQNFGRLFDDRANEALLNQVTINFERALVPQPGRFDWGFKVQFMYGSDARFTHSLGLFDRTAHQILQPDLVEAYLNLHFPVFTEGGLDLKLGKFVTLEGAETIDPRTNPFYSHTYIFNFGIPFNHTGALFTLYATRWLNLVAGVTRGVNTSIDDNNGAAAFHGGIGLHLDEEKFVVSAATHIGPETPRNDRDLRYLNTITTTWKITGKLTSITDLNYTHDDGADASAYGAAQYLSYAFNEKIAAKIRGELWRDDKSFYVAQFADPQDPVRGLAGEPITDPRTVGGGRTTYGALTIGLDLKPPVPKPLTGLVIRPELRVDHSFSETRPFNDSGDDTMFTAALDVIVTF